MMVPLEASCPNCNEVLTFNMEHDDVPEVTDNNSVLKNMIRSMFCHLAIYHFHGKILCSKCQKSIKATLTITAEEPDGIG